MGLLSWLLGPSKRVPADVFGVLDLSGGAAAELIEEDRAAVGPLFRETRITPGVPPACSVLFIYGRFTQEGRIESCAHSLREIIKLSGAPIVVVAMPNEGKNYRPATHERRGGRANLVLTLDRRGASFTRFFTALFTEMKLGTSMPRAWAKLAPQIPGGDHADCPATVFLCELGQLALS